MTTIINLSQSVLDLPNVIVGWESLNEETKEFMLSGTHYRVHGFQELIVYNERKAIASCSCFCRLESNMIEIENCWTEEYGDLLIMNN